MRWVLAFILSLYPVSALCQTHSAESTVRTKTWEKDPFSPPSAAIQLAEQVPDQISELQVSAILFSDEHSSAVINGRAYHIGDEISGHKVVDIKKGYVILGRGKKRYRLELRK